MSDLAIGFAPIEPDAAHTLILGSMPGRESLRHGEYYAHPRNAFWPIIGELIGALPSWPYAQRADALRQAGFMLWDVLAACERPGSLDAAIAPNSIRANDFVSLLQRQPGIRRVFCNGATAEALYRRHVLPTLPPQAAALPCIRLPSTSPAYTLSLSTKLAAWRVLSNSASA